MATRRALAPWFKLVFVLWLTMFVGVSLIYALGGSGFRFASTGATQSFNRESDYALLRVNDSLAFHVYPAKPDRSVSLTRYREGSLPFSPLLGRYESGREKMPVVTHRRGDWVYSQYPQYSYSGVPHAYNLRTGEAVFAAGLNRNLDKVDLAQLPEFASRGLLGAPADKIADPATLAQEFPALDVVRESQVVYVGGFLLVGFLLLLIFPFARRKVPVGA